MHARPLIALMAVLTLLVSMVVSGSPLAESATSLWEARIVHAMRVSMAVDVILDPVSADPKHGVVDADCRVHGMSNLFIAGSSPFPTGSTVNPTLTLVALALRLSDHLKRRFAAASPL